MKTKTKTLIKEPQFEDDMEYKCNNCGDTFKLPKQTKWSAFCFHCGKGLLRLNKVFLKKE